MNKDIASKVIFWIPCTVPFSESTSSVQVKPPEEGNKLKLGRNQTPVRTNAGQTFVYDRGNNYNNLMSLQFKDMPEIERAQLMVFLESIQWASTKVAYQDMYGDVHIVRVLGDNDSSITYEDVGLNVKTGSRNGSFIRFNFTLDLLDLTDNIAEVEGVDGPVTNALTLHLLDYDEPHNPEVCQLAIPITTDTTLEEFYTKDWKGIIWTVIAYKDTRKTIWLVAVTHDRNGNTIATACTKQEQIVVSEGDLATKVTFTADIDASTGANQKFFLSVNNSEADINICVRRLHVGVGQ